MLGESDGIPVTFAFVDASADTRMLAGGEPINPEDRTEWVTRG
jgi:hypothetical protein